MGSIPEWVVWLVGLILVGLAAVLHSAIEKVLIFNKFHGREVELTAHREKNLDKSWERDWAEKKLTQLRTEKATFQGRFDGGFFVTLGWVASGVVLHWLVRLISGDRAEAWGLLLIIVGFGTILPVLEHWSNITNGIALLYKQGRGTSLGVASGAAKRRGAQPAKDVGLFLLLGLFLLGAALGTIYAIGVAATWVGATIPKLNFFGDWRFFLAWVVVIIAGISASVYLLKTWNQNDVMPWTQSTRFLFGIVCAGVACAMMPFYWNSLGLSGASPLVFFASRILFGAIVAMGLYMISEPRILKTIAQQEADRDRNRAEEETIATEKQHDEARLEPKRKTLRREISKAKREQDNYLREEFQAMYARDHHDDVMGAEWDEMFAAHDAMKGDEDWPRLCKDLDLTLMLQVWKAKEKIRALAEARPRLEIEKGKVDDTIEFERYTKQRSPNQETPHAAQPAAELEVPLPETPALDDERQQILELYRSLGLPQETRFKTEVEELAEEMIGTKWKNASLRVRTALDIIVEDVARRMEQQTGKNIEYQGRAPKPWNYRGYLRQAGIIDEDQYGMMENAYRELSKIVKGKVPQADGSFWVGKSIELARDVLEKYQRSTTAKKSPQT